MRRCLLVLALAAASCAPFRLIQPEWARNRALTPDCRAAERGYLIAGALAAGLGVLAGASGIGSLADSSTGARVGCGTAALSAGALSAASTFLAGHYASRWARCAAN